MNHTKKRMLERAEADLKKRIAQDNMLLALIHNFREEMLSLDESVLDLEIYIDRGTTATALKIKSLEDLPLARKFMRKIYGKWNDKIGQIWSYADRAFVAWNSTDQNDVIYIRLETTVKDFPKELLKDGCVWRNTKTEEDHYSLVCEKKP